MLRISASAANIPDQRDLAEQSRLCCIDVVSACISPVIRHPDDVATAAFGAPVMIFHIHSSRFWYSETEISHESAYSRTAPPQINSPHEPPHAGSSGMLLRKIVHIAQAAPMIM